MEDSKVSQNVVHFTKSQLNFFKVNFGNLTMVAWLIVGRRDRLLGNIGLKSDPTLGVLKTVEEGITGNSIEIPLVTAVVAK